MPGSGPPSNTMFLEPPRVFITNRTSICVAILQGAGEQQADRQTTLQEQRSQHSASHAFDLARDVQMQIDKQFVTYDVSRRDHNISPKVVTGGSDLRQRTDNRVKHIVTRSHPGGQLYKKTNVSLYLA